MLLTNRRNWVGIRWHWFGWKQDECPSDWYFLIRQMSIITIWTEFPKEFLNKTSMQQCTKRFWHAMNYKLYFSIQGTDCRWWITFLITKSGNIVRENRFLMKFIKDGSSLRQLYERKVLEQFEVRYQTQKTCL